MVERKRSDVPRISRFETNSEDSNVQRPRKPSSLPPVSPKRDVVPLPERDPPVGGTLRTQGSRATLTESSNRSLEPNSSETRRSLDPEANGRRSAQPVRIRRPKGDEKRSIDDPTDTQPIPREEIRRDRDADSEKSGGQSQPVTSLLERLSMNKGERQPASWDREDNDNGTVRGDEDRDDAGWRKGGRRGSGRSKPRRARAQRS